MQDRPQIDPINQSSIPLRPEYRGLPREQIIDFWKDSWHDDQGKRWRVYCSHASREKSKYKERIIWASGNFFCQEPGEREKPAGTWSRGLNYDQNQVIHNKFFLNEEFQKKGFARQWLERSLGKYHSWDFQEVALTTGEFGLVTWPKLGYDFAGVDHTNLDWDEDYGMQIKELLDILEGDVKFAPKPNDAPALHLQSLFPQGLQAHPDYPAMAEQVEDIRNMQESPRLRELLDMLPSQLTRAAFYQYMVSLSADTATLSNKLADHTQRPQISL